MENSTNFNFQIPSSGDSDYNEYIKNTLTKLDTMIATYGINVKYPPFGLVAAIGDDDGNGNGTDDTIALQAILDYASQYGYDVIFPVGIYKITAPLTLFEKYDDGWVRMHWPRIIGQGFSSFEITYEGSVICGYNIPQGMAALNLIGESNGAATHGTLENIVIRCDHSSNHENSFALFVGDAWFFRAVKVKVIGKNALKTRCGSATTTDGTYAYICTEFTQCKFQATSTSGYAIYPEVIETSIGAGYDNLKFNTCLFMGLTVIYAFTAGFDNCMWAIYPRRDIITYDSGILNGYTVDFSSALWILSGITIDVKKCYFEDYRQAIILQPLGESGLKNIVIENCIFNAWTNYVDITNPGTNYKADLAISIKPNAYNALTGYVDTVTIRNNTFSESATILFEDIPIRNEAAKKLIMHDNSTYNLSTELRYVDTSSKTSHIVVNKQAHSVKIIDFSITLGNYDSIGKLYGTNINNYYFSNKCWVQRITIVIDRTLQSSCVIGTRKNNETDIFFNIVSTADNIYIENGSSVHVIEKNITSRQIFDVGDLMSVVSHITNIDPEDVGASILVKIELGF